jgi:hypothetical protein
MAGIVGMHAGGAGEIRFTVAQRDCSRCHVEIRCGHEHSGHARRPGPIDDRCPVDVELGMQQIGADVDQVLVLSATPVQGRRVSCASSMGRGLPRRWP